MSDQRAPKPANMARGPGTDGVYEVPHAGLQRRTAPLFVLSLGLHDRPEPEDAEDHNHSHEEQGVDPDCHRC